MQYPFCGAYRGLRGWQFVREFCIVVAISALAAYGLLSVSWAAHVVSPVHPAATGQVNPAIATDHLVRPTEIDQKGHVSNARYVEWLQWGRWEYLRAAKLPDQVLRDMGAVPVVVRVEVDYLAEVREGDTVKILTRPGTAGTKSFRFEQVVVRADGTEAAKAVVVMVCLDPTTRKAVELPGELRRLFGPG